MVHECWKSWVFSRRLKVLSDSSGVRSEGSGLFQVVGPNTAKLRWPVLVIIWWSQVVAGWPWCLHQSWAWVSHQECYMMREKPLWRECSATVWESGDTATWSNTLVAVSLHVFVVVMRLSNRGHCALVSVDWIAVQFIWCAIRRSEMFYPSAFLHVRHSCNGP